MKANRKFLNGDDDAVSPVIAVILMVAITVVLAATVYVWVSGFGASSSQPANTIALNSASALGSGGEKSFVVASATAGMKWSEIDITVDGVTLDIDASGSCSATTPVPDTAASEFLACAGTTRRASTDVIGAGDLVYLDDVAAGEILRVLDSEANSVIYTLTIG